MKQSNFRKCVISLTISVSLLAGSALATAKGNDWYEVSLQLHMQYQNLVVLKPQEQAAITKQLDNKEKAINLTTLVQPLKSEAKTTPVKPAALKSTIKAATQTAKKSVAKPVKAVQAKRNAPVVRLMKTEVAAINRDSTAAKKQNPAITDSTIPKEHILETPSGDTIKYSRLIPVKATAYTASAEENGLWGAFDFFGNPLKLGTIAVDPDVIPMGSTVYVTGYSFDGLPTNGMIAKATDQGSSISGKRVDIFIPTSREDAANFGMQDVKIYIIK
jgi:3D (Asp-Asp-Asp) domain-containing protein